MDKYSCPCPFYLETWKGTGREICGKLWIPPAHFHLANDGRRLDFAGAGKPREPQQPDLLGSGHYCRKGNRCQQYAGGWCLRCWRGNSTAGDIFFGSRGEQVIQSFPWGLGCVSVEVILKDMKRFSGGAEACYFSGTVASFL